MGFFTIILLLPFVFKFIHASAARDTITPSQPLTTGETVISAGGVFELGFFNSSSAAAPQSRQYLGIWFHNIPGQRIVWVANRRNPITGSAGSLTLTADGNLLLHSRTGNGVDAEASWSTNTSRIQNPCVTLLDSGNLVLAGSDSKGSNITSWQSFDYPSDTFLAGMRLGWDLTRMIEKGLTSWKADGDPSPGGFTYRMCRTAAPELMVWNGSSIEYRTGPWGGGKSWSGIPQMRTDSHFNFYFVNEPDQISYYYEAVNKSVTTLSALDSFGELKRLMWVGSGWMQYSKLPEDPCDDYGVCGAFGVCSIYNPQELCKCLDGFVPLSPSAWTLRDYSGGCVRRKELGCTPGGSGSGVGDGFRNVSGVKPPYTVNATVAAGVGQDECGNICLRNCSCVAYGVVGGICISWAGELMDIKEFTIGARGMDLFVRLTASELDSSGSKSSNSSKKHIIVIIIPLVLVSVLLFSFAICIMRRKKKSGVEVVSVKASKGKGMELPIFDMSTIAFATNNFSNENKLGEGGFGPVYKGRLGDGQEIAVKRLSRYSVQGLDEFKNEVMLIAKLQHRNLVRLLGCCIQGDERMLIYEYMQNKSLDAFIFDTAKCKTLDWPKRFEIILGIARGLLYLHQDSRLKIVHRDLKVSNVLLDKEMNPKISDFGMARIVRGDQMQESTVKVVGTYGYMSPEYAMHGIFSVKSDVFSFGVIVLEILTGKKNRVFDSNQPHISLVGHAWTMWTEGRPLELVDGAIGHVYSESEILRCMQVGLLCVQEGSDDRPTMASVVLMLGSEGMLLPQPKRPGFYPKEGAKFRNLSSPEHLSTVNEITVTMLQGR
ncbi:Receptor-like serine/threonine-protein kinase SD1-8 [Apostasia shenzhenica]|uniref:Receptor-like serine/threonine-protein kinase n=1 Tax=Apostasia shenzhenica TaxID=1088818 RepID=A0A2H9ZQW3_9ASPA|nr:Receptor-like serine/threonine-protein kinase SD1-8 [Apostasia shenzhenica]